MVAPIWGFFLTKYSKIYSSFKSPMGISIMTKQEHQIIDINTRIRVTGVVDQKLLRHLAIHAEGDFKEMRSLGCATPNDPEDVERYEDTELEFISTDCKLTDLSMLDLSQLKTNIVLAALRHMQSAIEKGEGLSYLDDIVDTNHLNSGVIDSLCEEINFSESCIYIYNMEIDKAYAVSSREEAEHLLMDGSSVEIGYEKYCQYMLKNTKTEANGCEGAA